MSVEELAAESSRVVRAAVVAQYVVPERGPQGQIYTRSEVRVLDNIQGDGPQHFIVQQLGGQLGDIKMWISGNADLTVGTEVVLFLERDLSTDIHYIVGLAQGHYEIDRKGSVPVVRRDLEGLTFYRVGPQPVPEIDQEQTLRALLERLRPRFDLNDQGAQGGLR